MHRTLKRLSLLLPGAQAIRNLRANAQLVRWVRAGMRGPPPALAKQGLLRAHAARFGATVLVETGTYLGDMALACHEDFQEIVTVEYDPYLARLAAQRLGRVRNVRVLHGDSAALLPGIVSSLSGPTIFWLDAHCSAGITSSPAAGGPILTELRVILSVARASEFLVLVDDARLFTGTGGYPTIGDVTGLVSSLQPGFRVRIETDAIHIASASRP